jgi:histone deacetylase complex subunit SAP30
MQNPWLNAPSHVLERYRTAYRLDVASAFYNSATQHLLNNRVGLKSPTMAGGRVEKRRQPKRGLAEAIKKHFDTIPINEEQVIARFLYKTRTKGKLVAK